ncbi:MAG TPA: adenylate/guanylate cyclase domain-containing protein [Rhizomicrobium sp.]|nr:adenylate/guanylate cyclase domain-containing protein [Rhizomicrobium sp.]
MNGWPARRAALVSRIKALSRNKPLLDAATAVAIALVMALLAMFAVDRVSFLTSADRFVHDWEIAFRSAPEPQDPNIRIIAFDEVAMQHFAYRSPLDRGALADLLTALDAKGARAIVVDYLFDQPTEPAKDAKLRDVLRTMKTPVVVSYFEAGTAVAKEQSDYLNAYVPPRLRALANIGTDQTDTVRWINPGGRTTSGEYLPSVQRRVAQIAGVETPAMQAPIAWRAPPGPRQPVFSEITACVQQLSACLPITKILPKPVLRDKIVLIGSDLSLVDQHRTPFATDPADPRATMPGVEILAYGIAQLIEHRMPPDLSWWDNFLIALLFAGLGAGLGVFDYHLILRGLSIAGLVAVLWASGVFVLYESFGVLIGLIAPTIALIGAFAAVESVTGLDARHQRQFIRSTISLYLPPSFVQQIIEDPAKLVLGGERREMSLLFTDIHGFTTMAEGLDSKDVGRVLNSYLDGMTGAIQRHEGTIDKFIGDAVFALWNAPLDVADYATKAVRCALEMDDFAESFRAKMNQEGIPLSYTRIGVHAGAAAVGNFGSRDRFSYTASGDAVNAASRLEGLNKTFGTRLCVSDAVKVLCQGIAFRPIGSVTLKGKTEALDVWEPLHDSRLADGFFARYEAAFAAVRAERADAPSLFAALVKEKPDDPLARFYLERLSQGETGIHIKMTEK